MNRHAHEKRGSPSVEGAAPDEAVALGDAPSRVEHEAEREIGGRFGQDSGRVGDRDAARRAGRDVDVVVPDGVVGDDAQPASALEERDVDRIGHATDDGVEGLGLPREGIAANAHPLAADLDVVRAREARDGAPGQRTADEDPSPHRFTGISSTGSNAR